MKKVSVLILSTLFISCLTEPKKENSNTSTNEMINPISPEKVENSIIDTALIKNEISQESTTIINETKTDGVVSKRSIIEELNNIVKNSGYSNINNTLSFLNENKGLMLLSRYEFKIDDVYAVFLYKDYNDGYGAFHVSIECEKKESGSNCMYDTNNPDYISATIFPLKTREACLQYVEKFNSLH